MSYNVKAVTAVNSFKGTERFASRKIDYNEGIPVKAYVRGGCQYPFHWHDTLEIIQVLKGSVIIGLSEQNLQKDNKKPSGFPGGKVAIKPQRNNAR